MGGTDFEDCFNVFAPYSAFHVADIIILYIKMYYNNFHFYDFSEALFQELHGKVMLFINLTVSHAFVLKEGDVVIYPE